MTSGYETSALSSSPRLHLPGHFPLKDANFRTEETRPPAVHAASPWAAAARGWVLVDGTLCSAGSAALAVSCPLQCECHQ